MRGFPRTKRGTSPWENDLENSGRCVPIIPGETKVGGSKVGGYIVRLCLKKTNFWRGFLMMMTLIGDSQKSYTPKACQACSTFSIAPETATAP